MPHEVRKNPAGAAGQESIGGTERTDHNTPEGAGQLHGALSCPSSGRRTCPQWFVMTALYPLRFHPLLRHYMWGGEKLRTRLGRSFDDHSTCAESWEICDRGADQSVVASGPLAGVTLGDLVATRGEELLGRHAPQPRFPLLFKFLDARLKLSVQVHPDDSRAAS